MLLKREKAMRRAGAFALNSFIALVLFTLGLSAPATEAIPAERLVQIEQLLKEQFPANTPGAVILMAKRGTPILHKSYGAANIEANMPLTPTDVFRVGSISKVFTATAILLLHEDGKLRLNDSVARHLPALSSLGRDITVEHLLTHTAGIADHTTQPNLMRELASNTSGSAIIDWVRTQPLAHAPGEKFVYNNMGYSLLGAIVESASGMSYPDFLKKRIFSPLMMANTGIEGAKGSSLSPVTGYRFHEGTFSTAPPVNVHATFAAGDLLSTAEDMDRWLRAVSSGKLLSAQTWQKALAQTSLKDGTRADYGHGWVVRKLRGQPLYEHTGVISGFQAMIMLLPESQLSVVFVSNRQTRHNNARKLGEQIAAIAIGKPLHQPVAIKLEETKLRLFEGTYQHEQSDRRSIRAEGAGLVLQFERQRVRLTPSGEDDFFVADGSHTRYRFVRDANGTVTQLIRIDVGDEEKRYARVELPSR